MKNFIEPFIILIIICFSILAFYSYFNVSSFSTNYIEEIDGKRYSKDQIVEKLFSSNIEKTANEELGKIYEYRIDNIDIVNFDNPKDIDVEAKNNDIFSVVTYSVRPTLGTKENWLEGNGQVHGLWITKKTNCLWIQENNGRYKIKGKYTGW